MCSEGVWVAGKGKLQASAGGKKDDPGKLC